MPRSRNSANVAFGVPARLQDIELRQHREGAADGFQRALVRLAKERHEAVTEKLVHDAVACDDLVRQHGQKFVEDALCFLRPPDHLAQLREASHVRKEHSHRFVPGRPRQYFQRVHPGGCVEAHVFEQLANKRGILDRDRRLVGEALQQDAIVHGVVAGALVEDLQNAQRSRLSGAARHRDKGHAHHGFGGALGSLVDALEVVGIGRHRIDDL